METDMPMTEEELLRLENESLKKRLAEFREACVSIADNQETKSVLQEMVSNACKLTGARYGVLFTFDPKANTGSYFSSGITVEQREMIADLPLDSGVFGYLNQIRSPVRHRDISTAANFPGFPEGHPLVRTFLGIPIYHRADPMGSFYLAEKEGYQEFTEEDENFAVMFAAQAAIVISSAHRYEEERRSKVDLEGLLDLSPVGVIVFDAQKAELAYINQEVRRMMEHLGFTQEGWENVYEYLSFRRADGRELSFAELPMMRVLQSGETIRAEEIVCYLPNGRSMTALINAAPVYSESGDIVSVVVVMQDMTPHEDQERRRADFLGLVSEELRTPLSTIKGSATALRSIVETVSGTESLQLLRIIDQQADLMRSQVNSLIELTEIETGKLSLVTEPVDTSDLIEDCCRGFLREHTAANSIELEIPDTLPKVAADKGRIEQVIQNFLRLAVRHLNEMSPIKVSASILDVYVAISVSAEGLSGRPAVSPQPFNPTETPQLFRKMSRSFSESTRIASKGEGLSIAFCRGIVEAHGGRMRADVDEKAGRLSLTFTLPVAEERGESAKTVDSGMYGNVYAPSPENNRILFWVDDSWLLNTVRGSLVGAGLTAIQTPVLEDVEQLVFSERVDLLLLDISSRQEECFQIIERTWNTLGIPIIVVCEHDSEELVVRAFNTGADGYVVKPFSSSELVARIRVSLRRKAGARETGEGRTFRLGEVEVNFAQRTLSVAEQPVQLTATEYNLLIELANNAGRVLTQNELLQRVWGPEYAGEPQLLRSYVKSLRQKLGDNARKPKYIFTEHGVGYRMARASNEPD